MGIQETLTRSKNTLNKYVEEEDKEDFQERIKNLKRSAGELSKDGGKLSSDIKDFLKLYEISKDQNHVHVKLKDKLNVLEGKIGAYEYGKKAGQAEAKTMKDKKPSFFSKLVSELVSKLFSDEDKKMQEKPVPDKESNKLLNSFLGLGARINTFFDKAFKNTQSQEQPMNKTILSKTRTHAQNHPDWQTNPKLISAVNSINLCKIIKDAGQQVIRTGKSTINAIERTWKR